MRRPPTATFCRCIEFRLELEVKRRGGQRRSRASFATGGGGNRSSDEPKPVVLFLPGLEMSSACFVENLPHQSAGFVFADANLDVWLANNRGTANGRRHEVFPPSDRQFWNFRQANEPIGVGSRGANRFNLVGTTWRDTI